ncbi:MAG: hypothetical protein E7443_05510 [Ruminococcaceae bacterium]|nr:hypothetical protein [Oscillospiraceae bacterium]
MKCEHCGKNEIAFVYRSNINGHVEERHLCGECAEKLGYSGHLEAQSRRMMRNLFAGSLFDDRFMEDFFAPVTGAAARRRWLLEDPFEDFFREMPVLQTAEKAAEQAPAQEELLEQAERDRFSRIRRLNALRLEQKKAVREENFERAAELRDEIKALESEDSGDKESA